MLPTAWQAVEYAGLSVGDCVAADVVRDLTGGLGADGVIDAVGMESHGAPAAKLAQNVVGLLPKPMARVDGARRCRPARCPVLGDRHGPTRRHDLDLRRLRRTGRSATYAELFDKQVTLRMGQADARRWTDDDRLPFLQDDADPLGVDDFATHRIPLDHAPAAYSMFQQKDDDVLKVVVTA